MDRYEKKAIVAVSGGPDSVYLLLKMKSRGVDIVAAHLNHRTRGRDSDADQRFVEELGKTLGIRVVSGRVSAGAALSEARMRKSRYRFLETVRQNAGSERVLVAHTADDQVETVLMRVFEGAGIGGLKGIPRKTRDGIERPILDVWREDILEYLKKHKISYRVDKSNVDTRFERNWIRHVLIPLLEKRYGKSVKKRIFALGERFREIDRFLEEAARKWASRNIREEKGREEGKGEKGEGSGKSRDGKTGSGRSRGKPALVFRRKTYAKLPSELRIRILQILCFEKAGFSPNERLLASMDRLVLEGGPSARLNVGKGAILQCRYDEALLRVPRSGEAKKGGKETGKRKRFAGSTLDLFPGIVFEEKVRVTPTRLRTLCRGERAAAFDGNLLATPVSIRPLRAGDRIRPFGLEAEKKVKEILIDRKVPREERWGRPVVCDAAGQILWIPGVIRSAHAPVSSSTGRTVVLRMEGGNHSANVAFTESTW